MSDAPDIVIRKQSRFAEDVGVEPDPLKGGDVYKWSVEQAALIRTGRYDEIDWINVADEIESVGKSEGSALQSDLTIILQHILQWDHQPSRRSRSWELSIREHRRRVDRRLRDNPSFKPKLQAACVEAYADGRDRALAETGLNDADISDTCPYDWDAIMTRPFVADQPDRSRDE